MCLYEGGGVSPLFAFSRRKTKGGALLDTSSVKNEACWKCQTVALRDINTGGDRSDMMEQNVPVIFPSQTARD